MKNSLKKLALLLLIAAAAGSSARAQAVEATPGKTLIFTSEAAADGWGEVTYQWYRDGQPIAGATDTTYTLPGNLAYGQSVEIKRGATSSLCPGEVMYSNVYLISFCALRIGALCWAATNVAEFRELAPRPDMYTQFYQWNKATAFSAVDPLTPAWEATANTSTVWTASPCPAGWRLPTQAELKELCTASGSTSENYYNMGGGTWAAANAKGNAVAGKFFGPNRATCTLPDNMTGCIFLPAGGQRSNSNGALSEQGTYGVYWTNTTLNADGQTFKIGSTLSNPNSNIIDKAHGLNLRCVQ